MIAVPVKDNGADNSCKQRAHGRSQPHRSQGVREQDCGQISSGNSEQENRDYVGDKGIVGFSVGTEISVKAEVDPRKNAVQNVGFYVLGPHENNFGFPFGK